MWIEFTVRITHEIDSTYKNRRHLLNSMQCIGILLSRTHKDDLKVRSLFQFHFPFDLPLSIHLKIEMKHEQIENPLKNWMKHEQIENPFEKSLQMPGIQISREDKIHKFSK